MCAPFDAVGASRRRIRDLSFLDDDRVLADVVVVI